MNKELRKADKTPENKRSMKHKYNSNLIETLGYGDDTGKKIITNGKDYKVKKR